MVYLAPDHFTKNLPAFLISIHPGSRAIYLICLLLVAGLMASLPLVRVGVCVTGGGMIRPLQEKAKIIPVMSGLVEEIYVAEGDHVRRSEPVLKLRSYDAVSNLQLLNAELEETDRYLADLKGLMRDPVTKPANQKFRTAYEEYCHRVDYLTMMYEKADREWNRQKGLYGAGLISDKEYDDLTFTKNKAKQERIQFMSESRRIWQDDFTTYLDRRRTLTKQVKQTEEQIRRSVILAPVSGSLEEFSGIFPGSVLQAGEIIGVISPDSRLIGEIIISSRDIAYIRTGQEVSIQVDAFPAREWGLATGEIFEVSDDYIWQDQQAVYRVKCQLHEKKMVLKNGYAGELLKGMTFQARCHVASRSLLQLLTDKADDWLDPWISRQVQVSP
jgi:multidrug resistance efflux pump